MGRGKLDGETATLNELRKLQYLHVICGHCGHGGNLLPKDTAGKIPNTTRLSELWTKLKCSRCGKRCCQTRISVRHR
jgi:hypothetical protein